MKLYRRYIRTSKYLDEDNNEYLFDDVIHVEIEVRVPIAASTSDGKQVFFPGVDQFRKDVVDVLENEYRFEVIEDWHDGKLQKGYASNRDDSISVYIDSYVDLAEIQDVIDKHGYKKVKCPEKSTKVFCFIHLRFSDHDLYDAGDVAHRFFIRENVKKYTENRPDVTHIVDEAGIILPESLVYRYYDQAIEYMRDEIDSRLSLWVTKADKYRRRED